MSSEGNVSGVVVDTPEVSKSINGVSVDSEQKVMVEGNLNTTDNQLTVDYKPTGIDAVNDVESKQAPSINLEETNENESQKEPLSPEGSDYFGNASLRSSIINMMNTIIGAGTISLPSTVLDGGIIGAGLLLLVSLILSLYGAHYLSAASIYTQEDSYGYIGKKLINNACGYAADFFMILFDFGISIGYCNIVFGQTVDLVASYTNFSLEVVNENKWWIALIETLVIIFPLLCIPTIDSLKWTSTIAIICITIFVVISIFMGISNAITGELTYHLFPRNFLDFTSALAVFFTCLCSHVNIPKMTTELKYPRHSKFQTKLAKMDRVNMIAFIACTVIYYSVGVCGYLAFGDKTLGNLLDNFTELNVGYLNLVKFAYAFVALFSYPVLSFSPLVSIDKTFFKQPRPTSRRILEAFIWSILCYVVAMLVPQIRVIFSLTGSLCGGVLAFVWPAIFFIYINKREKAKEMTARNPTFKVKESAITFAWILFYLGIVLSVFLTSLDIKNIIFS